MDGVKYGDVVADVELLEGVLATAEWEVVEISIPVDGLDILAIIESAKS